MLLRSPDWELEVRPERGGRITSLRLDRVELLDQGIGIDDPGAAQFVEGGAWGWDEMVPTVDATDTLPDHGEAWRLPWNVDDASPSSVDMWCAGRVVSWELARRIDLQDDRVRVSYRYTNRGRFAQLAYWCAHPLFRFETGMEIGVPGGGELAQLAPGTSKKVLLPKGSIDRAWLVWSSGAAIELSWDPALTPYVGVWVCNGDLGGYRQVAIEPATGGNDRPDPAAPPPLLGSGESLEWWLEVRDLR
ncbi:MAG: aldose epimerase family protein [Candidatus Dormibacteraceae bacterium]